MTLIAFAILNYSDSYNEYELLRQLGAGSEYAFTRLFDHYRGTIYGVALKFLKSPVLAEEIVQDVFLKVWHKREEMAGVKNLDAYLFIMARNFIFDRIKKMSYEAADEISIVMEQSSAPMELNGAMTNIENNGAPWPYNQMDRLNWKNEN